MSRRPFAATPGLFSEILVNDRFLVLIRADPNEPPTQPPPPPPHPLYAACFLRGGISTSQYFTRSGDNTELVVHLVRNRNAPRVRGPGRLEAPHAPRRRTCARPRARRQSASRRGRSRRAPTARRAPRRHPPRHYAVEEGPWPLPSSWRVSEFFASSESGTETARSGFV